MLLCADTVPESALRHAVEVLATQCFTKARDGLASTPGAPSLSVALAVCPSSSYKAQGQGCSAIALR